MAIPRLPTYSLPQPEDFPKNRVGWTFAPKRAVLLIHDMQDYFLHFFGEDSPLVAQLVANVAALRAFCTSHAVPVVYTAQPIDQSLEDRGLLNDMWGPGLNAHPQLKDIAAALAPRSEDIVLVKWRYSAFQRSPLEQMMREWGRDQLVICGVYGHIGCLTTALDSFMRDFETFVVGDAIADFSPEDHDTTLRYVAGRCGVVVGVDALIRAPASRLTRAEVEAHVRTLISLDGEMFDPTENLMNYGLDSVRVMTLATQWRKLGVDVGFVDLADNPTLEGWWALIERKLAAA
ncbi:isochorismatase family protein [Methylosinus sp. Sm6]|uniref:isochorismatase family protein n=1 Tax=Methylosinus sp. Sm6 TaxID=2866948 RepID=UPI001C9949C8|nr:isochorismatase family protein [Methylosinus sp. Sm6]MBY6240094.1 isochorismatase family protein [Methylosinus sp. Sm6]